MALYAMGDLHLGFQAGKSMDMFGRVWKHHERKIKKYVTQMVKPEDTLVLTGDHSWGRKLPECQEDLAFIDSDPGKVRAKAYDIVLNGNEIGGGSVRIHQNDIQEKMFEVLGFTREQAYSQFGFLLDAFKYGVPPHAGLAYGLDRLVMLMAGEDSIRDVIAFPKVKDASCLMTEAPTPADEKQLEELGLSVRVKEGM